MTSGINLTLLENNITAHNYGITFDGLDGGRINLSGNYIANNTFAGIYKSSTGGEPIDLIIMNNLIEKNTDGLDISSTTSEIANNIDLVNNTVQENGDDGITRLIAITGINATYNTIYSNNGSGLFLDGDSTSDRIKGNFHNNNISENHGTTSDFGAKIQDADEYTFTSNSFHNNTGYQLYFSNVQDSIIDGTTGNNMSTSVNFGIRVENSNSDNITINNLTISGGDNEGIDLTGGSNFTIYKNHITSQLNGIAFNNLGGGVVNISNNYIAYNSQDGIAKSSTSSEASDLIIEENTIENNVDGISGNSVSYEAGNSLKLHNNIIQANSDDGVESLTLKTDINVTSNTINNNSGKGIHVLADSTTNRASAQVQHNNVSENTGTSSDWGMNLEDLENLNFFNNTIEHNTGDGLELDNVVFGTVKSSRIHNSSVYGIVATDSTNTTVINSTITTSGTAMIQSVTQSNTSFINSTYEETFDWSGTPSSVIQFEWWVDIQVENQSGVIANSNVSVHNMNETLIFNQQTDSAGLVTGLNLTEYMTDDTTNTSFLNYTVHANLTSHSNNTTTFNLTLTNSTTIYLNLTGNAAAAGNSAPSVGVVEATDPITLIAGSITTVYCNATLTDTDGFSDISSANATWFEPTSTHDSADDNNAHYTNTSCVLQGGTGNVVDANCTMDFQYFANNSTQWACNISATDGDAIGTNGTGKTITVNQLKAAGVDSIIYQSSSGGSVDLGATSNESSLTLTNSGNVLLEVQLNASNNTAMDCRIGDIAQSNQRYNLSSGFAFGSGTFINVTKQTVGDFSVNQQKDESANSTGRLYWLLKLPDDGIQGPCNGTIQVSTV
jgi:hypothetical protein